MPIAAYDRVRESTTTTGTGTITLAGVAAGPYQSFAVVGNGNQCVYCIADQSGVGNDWEVGIGTYSTTGPSLARNTVTGSSNSGNLVNFPAGVKDVFVVYSAARSVDLGDVGTAPNQIPLNQFLGSMAYQDPNSVNIAGGIANNLQNLGNNFITQPTPTAITTAGSTTLTIAQLLTRIITVTQTAAVTLVLPTGTLADAGILGGQLLVGQAFDWNVINLGSSSGAVTMSAGSNNTYVGSATVAINTSATFRTLKTATNTYITYRVN
jgi:hypothetical protein